MKRHFILGAIVCAAVFLVALPAAANNKPVTGERIGLFAGPETFAADTPFYTEHGFVCLLGDTDCMGVEISARSWFELYVDGTLQSSTTDVDRSNNTIAKYSLFNFAEGLPAGEHTFIGKWYRDGDLFHTATAVVNFTP